MPFQGIFRKISILDTEITWGMRAWNLVSSKHSYGGREADMNERQTIIDVNPVEYSSSRVSAGTSNHAQAHTSSQSSSYQSPTWRAASSYRYGNPDSDRVYYGSAYTRFGDQTVAAGSAGSMLGGIAQMAVGAGLVLIGVPMLILPGPGLLSIGAGVALAVNGYRKVFG